VISLSAIPQPGQGDEIKVHRSISGYNGYIRPAVYVISELPRFELHRALSERTAFIREAVERERREKAAVKTIPPKRR
jgi:hypothetical protein